MSDDAPAKKRRVTLTEIAAELGVAPSTVSNAYNRPDQLSPALRQTVLDTAARLGYGGPDPVARSLRRRRAGAIGVLYSEQLSYAFADPAAVLVLQGVTMATEAAGIGLLLIPGSPNEERLPEMLGNAMTDGFIVYSMGDNDPANDAVLARGLPTVFVDQPPRGGAPFVGIDDEGGARLAAQHLLELGHRRFVILVDRMGRERRVGWVAPNQYDSIIYLPIRSRVRGYTDTLRAAGLVVPDVRVYECGDNTEAAAAAAMAALLADSPPTALLAFSDRLALGAMAEAQARGLDVPGDLSVVGFDDIPAAEHAYPALTTIRQPHVEKGRLAGEMLLTLLHDDLPPVSPNLPTRLIVRASTCPPRF